MASRPFDRDVWKKRVSSNAAGALVLFALLHILCSAAAPGDPGPLRMIALVLPVIAAIPTAARFEAHWHGLPDAPKFRRAAGLLWAAAAVVPFLWTGLYLLIG
jgi:hypothetical protein